MEVVAWFANETHSDRPECACPVIGAFVRSWNDSLPDKDRDRILLPLVSRIAGTKSTPDVEEARAWLATDWLIRTLTPSFLDLTPDLRQHADRLRALPPISCTSAADGAQPLIDAAGAAAMAAASDAAMAAAWDTAGSAAGAASWDAAGSVAYVAGAASMAAALDAAGAAADAALTPTVASLQASAVDLLERMIEVQP